MLASAWMYILVVATVLLLRTLIRSLPPPALVGATSQVVIEVLSLKARSVGCVEMLRESMKVAANAWSLSAALDGLDDWTIQQARPEWSAPQVSWRAGGQAN